MNLNDIIKIINSDYPFSYQEKYDNSGVIVGLFEQEINSILITLDINIDVIEEAIAKKCNLIISHHPIIFSAIKQITTQNLRDRAIILAIKNNISIVSLHTNFDNSSKGMSFEIAKQLGLKNIKILEPAKEKLFKIVTFCPQDVSEGVRASIFAAGGGNIGNYDCCSFNSFGEGTFRASEETKPYVGKKHILHSEKETKIETIAEQRFVENIINSIKKVHPYEEVAFDIYPLSNLNLIEGSGIIGEFEKEVATESFIKQISDFFNQKLIRHTEINTSTIKRVAFCGGSGAFLIDKAIFNKADIFISGDIKYHEFQKADNKIIIADIGHFESEILFINIIYEYLSKKFSNFAILKSQKNKNPIYNKIIE